MESKNRSLSRAEEISVALEQARRYGGAVALAVTSAAAHVALPSQVQSWALVGSVAAVLWASTAYSVQFLCRRARS